MSKTFKHWIIFINIAGASKDEEKEDVEDEVDQEGEDIEDRIFHTAL